MKFIFITYDGHGLPIAQKLQNEGYDVLVGQIPDLEFLEEKEEVKKRRLSLFDGLLEKYSANELIEKLKNEKNKEDYFVVCDFNFTYEYSQKLRELGFNGLLPTKDDYLLEKDRKLAKKYISKYYPIFKEEEYYEFKDVDEAIKFLKERNDKIWGIKGFNPVAPTFFSFSNDKYIAQLETIDVLEKNRKVYELEGFILEEKIEDLIEFVPEIIVSRGKILGLNINLELKYFGPENTAFQTGDSASFSFWISKDKWEKILDVFFPYQDFYLRRNDLLVVWDVGVMYSPSREGFYFTEFCPNRFGYNAIFNELSTFKKVGEFFERVKEGEELFDREVNEFGSSIRIFNEIRDSKDESFYLSDALVIADLDDKNVWLWDVYQKGGKVYTVGYDNNLAVITEGNFDWEMNFKIIDYKIKKNKGFVFTNAYYRNADDILSIGYQGNLKQRYNFVQKYILENDNFFDYYSELKKLDEKITSTVKKFFTQ